MIKGTLLPRIQTRFYPLHNLCNSGEVNLCTEIFSVHHEHNEPFILSHAQCVLGALCAAAPAHSSVHSVVANTKSKTPHLMGAKNSSILNLWEILGPTGRLGPAGEVLASTASQYIRRHLYSIDCRSLHTAARAI